MAKKAKGKRRIFHWYCQEPRVRILRGVRARKAIAAGKAKRAQGSEDDNLAEVTMTCNHASKTNGDHNVANHPIADFPLMKRFCPICRRHTEHKLKEPKSGAAGLAKAKNKK